MKPNKDVISRDADLDCAAVERVMTILRTAEQETSGWQTVVRDPDARAAIDGVVRALQDAGSDLQGSTEDMEAWRVPA